MASYYKPTLRGVTALRDVPCWVDIPPEAGAGASSSGVNGATRNAEEVASRFPVNEKVNSKTFLWRGEPWLLEVDAVVNSSTIHLDPTEEYAGLFQAAGPGLLRECATQGGCRTGEVKMTGGHYLPAQRVIHTVGPRYAVRYKTAAENALCHSYPGCLGMLVESNLRSISMGCIHLASKGYPRDDAAHVAVRTVRRFLERYADKVDAVVFSMTGEDYEHFRRCLPLYFPRNK